MDGAIKTRVHRALASNTRYTHVPRGVELHKGRLPAGRNLSIEGRIGELHGCGVRTANQGERGDGAERELRGQHY